MLVVFLLIYENELSIQLIGSSILFILCSIGRELFIDMDHQPRLHKFFLWVQLAIGFLVTCFDTSFISSIYLYFLISEMALTCRFRESFLYMICSYILYVVSRWIVFDFPAFQEISFVIPRSLEFVIIYAAFYVTKIAIDQKQELAKAYDKLDESSKEIDTLLIENERVRISREIHDSVGHVLTNTIVGIDTARKILQHDQAKAVAMLDSVRSSAQEGLEEVRATVHKMKATDDAFLDYRLAVDQLFLKTEKNTEVQITKEMPPDIPIRSPKVQMAVYRMLQEGLTNGLRHGKANRFTCLITVSAEDVVIQLKDNGSGFEPPIKEGFGLHAMRERIEDCGGKLQIESTLREGTVITCRVHAEK